MKPSKSKTICMLSTYVTIEVDDWIISESKERGVSKSEFVRGLIENAYGKNSADVD